MKFQALIISFVATLSLNQVFAQCPPGVRCTEVAPEPETQTETVQGDQEQPLTQEQLETIAQRMMAQRGIQTVKPEETVDVDLLTQAEISKLRGPTGGSDGEAPPALSTTEDKSEPKSRGVGAVQSTQDSPGASQGQTGTAGISGAPAVGPSDSSAASLKKQIEDKISQGKVESLPDKSGKHFLFVVTENPKEKHRIFIADKDPNNGRFYVEDATTGTTLWAPASIEAQAKEIYRKWKESNPENDPFPQVADKALNFTLPVKPSTPGTTTPGLPTQPGGATNPGGSLPATQGSTGSSPSETGPSGQPSAAEPAATQPRKEEDHITPTQGNGLRPHPSTQVAGKDTPFAQNKKLFVGKEDEKTKLSDIAGATNKVITANDIDYTSKTLRQRCYSKDSKEPKDITAVLLTNPNDKTDNRIFVQPGTLTDEQIQDQIHTVGINSGKLEEPNDETNAVTYTEANPEDLVKEGFLHKQISIRKDGSGSFAIKYVQKTGPIEPASAKFKDDWKKDKIFYCSDIKEEAKKEKSPEELEKESAERRRGRQSKFKQVTDNPTPIERLSSCMNCHQTLKKGPQSLNDISVEELNDAIGLEKGSEARMPKVRGDDGKLKVQPLSDEDKKALSDYFAAIKPK